MALAEFDSAVGHTFGLDLDGIVMKAIMQVDGLTMENEVIELRQNTVEGKPVLKALPGPPKRPMVTVKRGLDGTPSLDKWFKQVRQGNMKNARITAAIVVYDLQGKAVKRYNLINAWVSRLEVSTLKAGDTSVLTETITITAEDIEVE